MDDQRADREGGGSISIFRPSLGRLLVSAALIVGGIAILVCLDQFVDGVAVPLWFVSGMIIGAGVFAPFKLTPYGILVGLIVQIASFVLLLVRGFQAMGGI
jgi:integral membrane sensor domain MASE1